MGFFREYEFSQLCEGSTVLEAWLPEMLNVAPKSIFDNDQVVFTYHNGKTWTKKVYFGHIAFYCENTKGLLARIISGDLKPLQSPILSACKKILSEGSDSAYLRVHAYIFQRLIREQQKRDAERALEAARKLEAEKARPPIAERRRQQGEEYRYMKEAGMEEEWLRMQGEKPTEEEGQLPDSPRLPPWALPRHPAPVAPAPQQPAGAPSGFPPHPAAQQPWARPPLTKP